MKYKLTQETIEYKGHTLYRIEALEDFGSVRKGDKGGFVESETNLSQDDNCWVGGNAKVYGNAVVYGDAQVYGNAWIYGNSRVYGNTKVYGNAWIYGCAQVYGCTEVFGDAEIYGCAEVCGNARIVGDAKVANAHDYIVFKNNWSSGRYFTWTRSNNKWKVGCFYGTGEALVAKANKDSEISGREYKRLVDYVKSILQDTK